MLLLRINSPDLAESNLDACMFWNKEILLIKDVPPAETDDEKKFYFGEQSVGPQTGWTGGEKSEKICFSISVKENMKNWTNKMIVVVSFSFCVTVCRFYF